MNTEHELRNKTVPERLEALRAYMLAEQINYYIIPTGDDHQSEYIGDYFKAREYMSGFTGSAGTLLVSAKEAGLWTDGRYFVQAEHELEGSTITLFRMQEDGVPALPEYLAAKVWDGAVIGFDGRMVSAAFQEKLLRDMPKIIQIRSDTDLVDAVWTDRPKRSAEAIYALEDSIAGISASEKLRRLRERLEDSGAKAVLLSSLEDIMWLYNLRGNDVPCTPVALSFAYITHDTAMLFADTRAVSKNTEQYLEAHGIEVRPYDSIYAFSKSSTEHLHTRLLADTAAVSLTLYQAAEAGHAVTDVPNYRLIPKAVKNSTEIELCRKYHILDAVAVTRFIYWLKTSLDIAAETELSVAQRLEEFRKEQEGYREPSFETIAAYGSNAAMIHYTADVKTDTELAPKGMLLVDSGGQYYGATTDITRTIVLGELTEEQKEQYTAVVCGMLRLADVEFLYGCTGRSLDLLAREPLWKLGLDYRHGTGHGVGSYLSVHEGPQAFRWKMSEALPEVALEPGMVITDEPGIYIEGSHGIRIENELLCVEKYCNQWGRFLGFETLTYVPIDREAILPEKMPEECKKMLNVYHGKVYELLCPYLTDSEKKWLSIQTAEI